MVEFISEAEEKQELDVPEPEEQPAQKALEELVEEQTEELQSVQNDQQYVDEPSSVSGEYHQPENHDLKNGPELKHELKPLVYEDNEQIVVIDIFEKYSKNEGADDKWWKQPNKY